MKEYGTSLIDLLHFEITQEEAIEMSKEDGFDSGAAWQMERLNRLAVLLKEQDRADDYFKAATDPAFQEQLLEEFNLK